MSAVLLEMFECLVGPAPLAQNHVLVQKQLREVEVVRLFLLKVHSLQNK